MYCEVCGRQIDDHANFCKYCGTKVLNNELENRLEENPYYNNEETDYNFEDDYNTTKRPVHNKLRNTIVWGVLICLLVAAVFYNTTSKSSTQTEDHNLDEVKVTEIDYYKPNITDSVQVDAQTNSMNGGYVTTFNDYTYYINVDGNIYRMNQELKIPELVINGTCQYLCSYEDYLIYTDENFYIHRYDTLTSEDDIIISTGSYYLTVSGSKLFYQNDPDGESIFSLDFENGDMKQYNDEQSYNIMYKDESIYYSTKKGIYELDMNTSTTTQLVESNAYCYNIIDDSIYYLGSDYNIYQYDMNSDKTNRIVDCTCYEMVCNDQYICFMTYNNDNYRIGYLKLDDVSNYYILDITGEYLAINGNYLFYTYLSTYVLDLENLYTMEINENSDSQSV